ncbi:MAG: hypothetical protein VX589_12000 [Myxococcota bacterium]|nr:hypothetical protein [Myxococcota bacterium]
MAIRFIRTDAARQPVVHIKFRHFTPSLADKGSVSMMGTLAFLRSSAMAFEVAMMTRVAMTRRRPQIRSCQHRPSLLGQRVSPPRVLTPPAPVTALLGPIPSGRARPPPTDHLKPYLNHGHDAQSLEQLDLLTDGTRIGFDPCTTWQSVRPHTMFHPRNHWAHRAGCPPLGRTQA